jgi:hypothetical protein
MQSRCGKGEWTGRDKDRYAGRADLRAVGGVKDRTQEPEAEKRSVARGGTQGREWVGLNSTSPLAWRCGLPSQFHAAHAALVPIGRS